MSASRGRTLLPSCSKGTQVHENGVDGWVNTLSIVRQRARCGWGGCIRGIGGLLSCPYGCCFAITLLS